MRTARRLLRVLVTTAVIAGVTLPAISAAASPIRAAPIAALPAKPTLASLQQQIKTQSTALEKLVETYDGVNAELAKNGAAATALQTKMLPTQLQMAGARQKVATIATTVYMDGDKFKSLSAVISATSPSDLINQLTTMDQMATDQQEQIAGFQLVQDRYTQQQQALENLITTETAQKKSLLASRVTINAQLKKLYALRATAFGHATESSGGSHPTAPYSPGRGGQVVKFAYAQLGKPYAWAADGPGSYDCSGLVLAAYRSVGVTLYHKASVQWTESRHISRSELSPGDLVFYSGLSHVAIYIGGGQVIHAPTFGEDVKISSVDMMTPYGYGRP